MHTEMVVWKVQLVFGGNMKVYLKSFISALLVSLIIINIWALMRFIFFGGELLSIIVNSSLCVIVLFAVLCSIHIYMTRNQEHPSVIQEVAISKSSNLENIKRLLVQSDQFSLISSQPRLIRLRRIHKRPFFSFGESIIIQELNDVDKGNYYHCRSQPIFSSVVFDFGANYKNLRKIEELITNQI